MGLYRDQAIRLLREDWGSINEAMEELYAIFTSDVPVQIDSPVTITAGPNSNSPPLTLRNFGNSEQIINIERSALQPNFPNFPGFDPADIGDYIFTVIWPDGTAEGFPGREPNEPQPPQRGRGEQPTQGGGGGGGLPGQVTSGSGSTYQVTVYRQGLAGPGESVSVRQLSIASDESIDAGTWVIVVQTTADDGTVSYYMQHPVWGPDGD